MRETIYYVKLRVPGMSEGLGSDFLCRERIRDALRQFQQRIRERVLAIDESECRDLLLNRPATPKCPPPAAHPLPLRYETHDGVSLLRVIVPEAENRACPQCDFFGRCHCGGGLLFLYYALRDAGVREPLEWLAVELAPNLYLPDWELMQENSGRILRKLREYFEARQ